MADFKEFVKSCKRHLKTQPALIKLIKKRYRESDDAYRRSSEFEDSLQITQAQIESDPQKGFIYLKNFLDDLKDRKSEKDVFSNQTSECKHADLTIEICPSKKSQACEKFKIKKENKVDQQHHVHDSEMNVKKSVISSSSVSGKMSFISSSSVSGKMSFINSSSVSGKKPKNETKSSTVFEGSCDSDDEVEVVSLESSSQSSEKSQTLSVVDRFDDFTILKNEEFSNDSIDSPFTNDLQSSIAHCDSTVVDSPVCVIDSDDDSDDESLKTVNQLNDKVKSKCSLSLPKNSKSEKLSGAEIKTKNSQPCSSSAVNDAYQDIMAEEILSVQPSSKIERSHSLNEKDSEVKPRERSTLLSPNKIKDVFAKLKTQVKKHVPLPVVASVQSPDSSCKIEDDLCNESVQGHIPETKSTSPAENLQDTDTSCSFTTAQQEKNTQKLKLKITKSQDVSGTCSQMTEKKSAFENKPIIIISDDSDIIGDKSKCVKSFSNPKTNPAKDTSNNNILSEKSEVTFPTLCDVYLNEKTSDETVTSSQEVDEYYNSLEFSDDEPLENPHLNDDTVRMDGHLLTSTLSDKDCVIASPVCGEPDQVKDKCKNLDKNRSEENEQHFADSKGKNKGDIKNDKNRDDSVLETWNTEKAINETEGKKKLQSAWDCENKGNKNEVSIEWESIDSELNINTNRQNVSEITESNTDSNPVLTRKKYTEKKFKDEAGTDLSTSDTLKSADNGTDTEADNSSTALEKTLTDVQTDFDTSNLIQTSDVDTGTESENVEIDTKTCHEVHSDKEADNSSTTLEKTLTDVQTDLDTSNLIQTSDVETEKEIQKSKNVAETDLSTNDTLKSADIETDAEADNISTALEKTLTDVQTDLDTCNLIQTSDVDTDIVSDNIEMDTKTFLKALSLLQSTETGTDTESDCNKTKKNTVASMHRVIESVRKNTETLAFKAGGRDKAEHDAAESESVDTKETRGIGTCREHRESEREAGEKCNDNTSTNCYVDAETKETAEIKTDITVSKMDETAGSSSSGNMEEKKKKKGSKKQIERLEGLLEKIRNKIEELKEMEVDLEDEDSAYIMEDKYQRKFVKVWNKLCELKESSTSTGRPVERKFRYSGTRYPDINRKIEKFINKKKCFPDYHDIKDIITGVSLRQSLGLKNSAIERLAREAFADVGDQLQKRRQDDFYMTFPGHLHSTVTAVRKEDDPAYGDGELCYKLEENKKASKKRMNEVLEQFVEKQYKREKGEESDSDRGEGTEESQDEENDVAVPEMDDIIKAEYDENSQDGLRNDIPESTGSASSETTKRSQEKNMSVETEKPSTKRKHSGIKDEADCDSFSEIKRSRVEGDISNKIITKKASLESVIEKLSTNSPEITIEDELPRENLLFKKKNIGMNMSARSQADEQTKAEQNQSKTPHKSWSDKVIIDFTAFDIPTNQNMKRKLSCEDVVNPKRIHSTMSCSVQNDDDDDDLQIISSSIVKRVPIKHSSPNSTYIVPSKYKLCSKNKVSSTSPMSQTASKQMLSSSPDCKPSALKFIKSSSSNILQSPLKHTHQTSSKNTLQSSFRNTPHCPVQHTSQQIQSKRSQSPLQSRKHKQSLNLKRNHVPAVTELKPSIQNSKSKLKLEKSRGGKNSNAKTFSLQSTSVQGEDSDDDVIILD